MTTCYCQSQQATGWQAGAVAENIQRTFNALVQMRLKCQALVTLVPPR